MVYAKLYGGASGLLPQRGTWAYLGEHLDGQRALPVGGLAVVVGLGVTLWGFQEQLGQDMSGFDVQLPLRHALWGLVTTMVGVQTIFGSSFLSMLGMGRAERK